MTSEPKWTKGPWQKNGSHIYAPDGAIIATVHNTGKAWGDYPLVDNRDLMTAAPDLYEALDEAEALTIAWTAARQAQFEESEPHPVHQKILDKIAAALARARGEP